MGCYTVYIVRESDGSLWMDSQKWGAASFASARELEAHLAELERHPVRGPVDAADCRGWYVDRGARVVRLYQCQYGETGPFELEASLRAEPGWAGWDVRVVHDKYLELSALSGQADRGDTHAAQLDDWRGCAVARLYTQHPEGGRFPHRWDAEARELTYAWYYCDGFDLTLIDATGEVRDFGFDDAHGMFAALGHGPALIAALDAAAPCPFAASEATGALIDAERRELWFYLSDPIAPSTLAELRRRWPGWSVQREPAGHRGQLQRTGRLPADAVPPYALEPRALRPIATREVPELEDVVVPPSPEDQALLAAIHADLDSDAARRVYADLLLSRGDPRGALINVQCELESVARTDGYSPARTALAHEARLLGFAFAPGSMTSGSPVLRRGFVETWRVRSVRALIDEATLAHYPTIDHLELPGPLTAEAARELAAAPGCARIRRLELAPEPGALTALCGGVRGLRGLRVSASHGEIAGELLAVLGAPALAELDYLGLCDTGFSPHNVPALLGAVRGPLRDLLLAGLEPLDARDLARMVATPIAATLRRLTVRGPLAPDALVPLARLPELTSLDVSTCRAITATAATVALASLPSLRRLSLVGCSLDPDGLATLIESPGFGHLQCLALGHLTPDALAALDPARLTHLGSLEVNGAAEALAPLRARLGEIVVS